MNTTVMHAISESTQQISLSLQKLGAELNLTLGEQQIINWLQFRSDWGNRELSALAWLLSRHPKEVCTMMSMRCVTGFGGER